MTIALDHMDFSAVAERISALYNKEEDALAITMLGQEYMIRRNGVSLRGQKAPESHERILVDYLSSSGSLFIASPWQSMHETTGRVAPDFRNTIELVLAQHASQCIERASTILPFLDAQPCRSLIGSDLAFSAPALPKVHIHVELSRESQEFPPEAWILFSRNAADFLSADGLCLLCEVFKDRLLGLLRIY